MEDPRIYLAEKSIKLKATDFNQVASFVHHDGSTCSYHNALLEEYHEHILIWTEHLGNFWFNKEDLEWYESIG